jgi:hypothetical protein
MVSLTKEEKEILSQIAQDQESGNHLLRPRSDKYKELYNELVRVLDSDAYNWSDRDMALIREYRKNFKKEEY